MTTLAERMLEDYDNHNPGSVFADGLRLSIADAYRPARPSISDVQIDSPVTALTANTELPPCRYITPSMTRGVTCRALIPAGMSNDQRRSSWLTLEVLMWSSSENRWLY